MNAQQEEALSVLNHLIGICREGQDGFRNAAEAIEGETELRMLLSSFSLQRAKFAGELEAIAIQMGEHDAEHEGAPSFMRRGWVQFRSLITGKSVHAILSECERNDRVAKQAYQKAMRNHLPDPVRELVLHQRQEVIAAHNTLRALRDAAAPRPKENRAVSMRNGAADVWQDIKSRTKGKMGSSAEDGWAGRHPIGWVLAGLGAGFALGLAVYLWELRQQRQPAARLEQWRNWWGAQVKAGRKTARRMDLPAPLKKMIG